MLNYFRYKAEKPKEEMFRIDTELKSRENGSRLLYIHVQGKEEVKEKQNITVLLDVSGSMSGNAEQTQAAVATVISKLKKGDTFSLVTYSSGDAVELEACLADSWEWVDDYTLKLHVREGVTFQNGKAVDAAAVKASFEHTAEINNRFAMYIDLKEFIADGQYFTIVSNSHNPQMLWNLVEPCFCVMDVTVADIENAPVGTGPYKFVSTLSQRSRMRRHE